MPSRRSRPRHASWSTTFPSSGRLSPTSSARSSSGTRAFRSPTTFARRSTSSSPPADRRSPIFLSGLLAPTLTALLRAATFLLGLVVIPVWLFFVLKDREGFSRSVAGAMPPGWRADVENLLGLLGRVGGRWVRGQLLLGLSIFVATVIGLGLLTLVGFEEFGQFTLVLALIAGVLEWLPIIGPIVAAVPAILIGLSIGPPAAIAAAVLYTGIQQLENHILVPKVMGDAVDLHPAVLIMALVVGGALFGIGGAILAAPTVAAGRDLYRYGFHRFGGQPPTEALELAMHGARPPRPPEEPPARRTACRGRGHAGVISADRYVRRCLTASACGSASGSTAGSPCRTAG